MGDTVVHIAIGNSDDKLSQAEWAEFAHRVDTLVRAWAMKVHGYWHSVPTSMYQNAAWAFEPPRTAQHRNMLRELLAEIAGEYRQESISWNESVTEFITAKES